VKNNPFGDLRKQLGLPDPGTSEPRDSGTPEPRNLGTPELRDLAAPGLRNFDPKDFDRSGPARAVVRYERNGRGGKEVTVIEQLGLSQTELLAWLKQLKSALGCGGSVETDTIMLQGDHRKRLPAILKDRRVRKIIVS